MSAAGIPILPLPNGYILLLAPNGGPALTSPPDAKGLSTRVEVTPYCVCATRECADALQAWLDHPDNLREVRKLGPNATAVKLALARLSQNLTAHHESSASSARRATPRYRHGSSVGR